MLAASVIVTTTSAPLVHLRNSIPHAILRPIIVVRHRIRFQRLPLTVIASDGVANLVLTPKTVVLPSSTLWTVHDVALAWREHHSNFVSLPNHPAFSWFNVTGGMPCRAAASHSNQIRGAGCLSRIIFRLLPVPQTGGGGYRYHGIPGQFSRRLRGRFASGVPAG